MRMLVALLGITVAFSLQAAEKPQYKKSDKSLYGVYEVPRNQYGRIERLEYREDDNGTPSVFLGSGRRATSYEVEEKNGKLIWGGYYGGECDDPGCGYLSHVEGTIEPLKYRGKYVPHMKIMYIQTYEHPDEEDAPEGDVESRAKLRKKKDIEDAVPYYVNMDKAELEDLQFLEAQCDEAKHSAFRDLVLCMDYTSWQFRLSPRGKVFDRFLQQEVSGAREDLIKIKTVEDIEDGYLVLLEAGARHAAVISKKKKEELKAAKDLMAHFEDLKSYLVEYGLEDKAVSMYLIVPKWGGIHELKDAKILIVNYASKQTHILKYKQW